MYKLDQLEDVINFVVHNPAIKWLLLQHSRSLICCCVIMPQVDSLSERVEELKQDKKRLVEEYEAKLSKVQYWSTCALCAHFKTYMTV